MNSSLPPLPPRRTRPDSGLPPIASRPEPGGGLPPIAPRPTAKIPLDGAGRLAPPSPADPPTTPIPLRSRRGRRAAALVSGVLVIGGIAGAVSSRVFGPEKKVTVTNGPTVATPSTSDDVESRRVNAVAQVAPSVVEVTTEIGQGSGVIVQPQGLIVTNNHVIKNATRVGIVTSSGANIPADVVAADEFQDLAILRPAGSPGVGIRLAEDGSGPPKIGSTVFAIGSPFGYQNTVTTGTVSALREDQGRPLIQFDAPVNPGNSGGGLFDLDGRLVGIPTLIQSPIQGNVGLGFAVPSSRVRAMLATVQ